MKTQTAEFYVGSTPGWQDNPPSLRHLFASGCQLRVKITVELPGHPIPNPVNPVNPVKP
jgi:hypothetical protein